MASAIAITIVACTTTPTKSSESKPVPPEYVYLSGEGESTIIVTRDSGFLGSGCQYGLVIDGKAAADFKTGETATFRIASGDHILGIGASKDPALLCRIRPTINRETALKPGQVKRFRITIMAGSDGADILPVAD
ncbi:MAG: hypothetical protein JSS42_13095 [Proteobacteria bacterium]|nr:hypothetical protein [Pseudomonadota bacterium]